MANHLDTIFHSNKSYKLPAVKGLRRHYDRVPTKDEKQVILKIKTRESSGSLGLKTCAPD